MNRYNSQFWNASGPNAKMLKLANEVKYYQKIGNIKKATAAHQALFKEAGRHADKNAKSQGEWISIRDDSFNEALSQAKGDKLMGLGGGGFI